MYAANLFIIVGDGAPDVPLNGSYIAYGSDIAIAVIFCFAKLYLPVGKFFIIVGDGDFKATSR